MEFSTYEVLLTPLCVFWNSLNDEMNKVRKYFHVYFPETGNCYANYLRREKKICCFSKISIYRYFIILGDSVAFVCMYVFMCLLYFKVDPAEWIVFLSFKYKVADLQVWI